MKLFRSTGKDGEGGKGGKGGNGAIAIKTFRAKAQNQGGFLLHDFVWIDGAHNGEKQPNGENGASGQLGLRNLQRKTNVLIGCR